MAPRKSFTLEELERLRELNHLVSVGDAALRDFDLLGIETVEELAECDPKTLYDRLCKLKGTKLDPCCEDVFRAAVAQAKDPDLPAEQRNWWYWSRMRKAKVKRDTFGSGTKAKRPRRRPPQAPVLEEY